MTKNKTMEAMTKMVELLQPLSSEERQRIIRASLTLLGDVANENVGQSSKAHTKENVPSEIEGTWPARAKTWMKQNELSEDQIDQVFHLNGEKVEFIASDVPGKNSKDKTYHAFIMTGITRLLETGEASFSDKDARALCNTLGCYSDKNHATYMKDKGNAFSGTKDKGWTLTAPGLKQAAALIKELCK